MVTHTHTHTHRHHTGILIRALGALGVQSEAIRLLAAVFFLEGGISCPYDEYSGGAWQPGMKATETTESASPDETGVYATPVYFDWRACWPSVKELFDQPETQRILHLSVAHSRGEEKWGVFAQDLERRR